MEHTSQMWEKRGTTHRWYSVERKEMWFSTSHCVALHCRKRRRNNTSFTWTDVTVTAQYCGLCCTVRCGFSQAVPGPCVPLFRTTLCYHYGSWVLQAWLVMFLSSQFLLLVLCIVGKVKTNCSYWRFGVNWNSQTAKSVFTIETLCRNEANLQEQQDIPFLSSVRNDLCQY